MQSLVKLILIKSKEFLDIIDEASQFALAKMFDFLRVNCANEKLKDLCDKNSINKYPTTKIYLKGEEIYYVPLNRDLESILEYVDKINSPLIRELEKIKNLNDFSKNYGDVSFLFVDYGDLEDYNLDENKKNVKTNLLKCYKKIAEKYKPVFYFAYVNKKKYRNYYNIKLPAIIVNFIFD